ncbi:leukocyte surface antigen CD53-like isoform X2 [Cydia pomonella]|uniref:leukocyte surface antigen CD53-like isoform X2 n=1 Tax=Cydia pomonella TaxID=82600 RepID=UPI002ADE5EB7|nr:leukocyte surface antigen CD53-like isoform X2 [Cydia pomonella]
MCVICTISGWSICCSGRTNNIKMGCGESTVKYLLFVFNLVFALAGAALLGIGVAGYLNVEAVAWITGGGGVNVPIFYIVLGSLVFVVAFFGCCGAVTESQCMLFTFSIFMGLLMVLKVILMALVFVKKEWLDDVIAKTNEALEAKGALKDPVDPQTIRICFAGVCSAIIAVEMVGMVFGCCLAVHVRRNNGYGYA